MGKTEWIKKYTKYEYLKNILHKQSLFLGDPSDWPDKNDAYAIGLAGFEKPAVTCLTSSQDRFHFWTVFGNAEEGVCLWFERDEFISALKGLDGLKFGKVEYPPKSELKKGIDAELGPAFYKREQYKDEKEFRIIRPNAKTAAEQWLRFEKTSLKRIFLNSWLQPCCVKRMKAEINKWLDEFGYPDVLVQQNRVKDSGKWKDALRKANGQ